MYHFIVRRKLASAFRDLNAGAYERIVPQFAARHRHVMYGTHALAGERCTMRSTSAWYDRLKRLLPGLRFEVRSIVVGGWPWRTVALVSWTDHFSLPDGSAGSNQGVHEFELRWGRVTGLAVHCDTAKLQAYCARIAAAGLPEALAAPIDDGPPLAVA
jgi:hypothetical protein